jgi:tetratricopeptide (TPR) repeat protein
LKKQQIILIGSGILMLALLFFWGNTIPPQAAVPINAQPGTNATNSAVATTDQLIAESKKNLPAARLEYLTKLENSVVRGDVKDQQIHAFHQLARFWEDSVHNHLLEAYYRGEAAKLENSEKNLTFAARLMLDQLITEENPTLQHWLGTQAKALLEQSLEINPSNDSAKVGIGACYMFGNISDQPMQGILAVREVAEKNPDNLYAQMMLGLGGMKSGQFDKAIERFRIIAEKEPNNLEAIFRLAECYDRTGDKANAVKWYKDAEKKIGEPSIKKEIENRIKALQ